MTDNSNRYGDAPLGKSVEEVEQESGNLVNPPVEGEAVRANMDAADMVVPAIPTGVASGMGAPGTAGAAGAVVPLVPSASNGNASAVPAVVNPAGLVDDGLGMEESRNRTRTDSEGQV